MDLQSKSYFMRAFGARFRMRPFFVLLLLVYKNLICNLEILCYNRA
jgi:hypothetical protein